MWNLNDVIAIEYASGYCYRIVFDDNTGAVIDFSEYLDGGPVFAPLRNLDFFRKRRSRAAPSLGRTEQTLRRKRCMKNVNGQASNRHSLPSQISSR